MSLNNRLFSLLLAGGLAVSGFAFAANEGDAASMSADQVQEEATEAMQALAEYSAQERDQALSAAREAMAQLDQEIDAREETLREQWADMSKSAREQAKVSLAQLRDTRNALGERYGALESGMDSAWDELKAGFAAAYEEVVKAWESSGSSSETNAPE